MPVAVLADIHSNPAALAAVLADAAGAGACEAWIAGDMFGRGSDAAGTWRLLHPSRLQPGDSVLFQASWPMAVTGNHDRWVAGLDPAPAGPRGDAARANAACLDADALGWLAALPQVATRRLSSGWRVTMCHGTPAAPSWGRYYPDDATPYSWLPGPGDILILGNTHWPMVRGTATTGMVLNPGSVGEPRDGNPRPSWALLDLAAGTAELHRATVR